MNAALRLVVPFGRDGAADRVARGFGQALAAHGIRTLIENLPGAGGGAGLHAAARLAAQAVPVLLLATPSTHSILPLVDGNGWREFESAARWAPIAGLGWAPNVLLVSPALGVRSLAELLALGRGSGGLSCASAGAWQTIHLCAASFCATAGVAMLHRPYTAGSAAAYDDLGSGRVQLYFDNLLGCVDRVAAGDAQVLAVSSRERVARWPGVPTLDELGFPGHRFDVWFGLFGAHLERAITQAITQAALAVELAATLSRLGLSGPCKPAAELEVWVQESRPRWRAALEDARRLQALSAPQAIDQLSRIARS